ncbi:MAG TPA: hypothetical protein VJC11_02645 [Patescibacteria group bacterium]|nr:hypothetical protein [Patescibacteria group bacterium]
MNLMGLAVSDNRAQQKVTVLKKKDAWSDTEVGLAVTGLCTAVCGHPKHPNVLLLAGEFSKDTIATFILERNFECEVVQGMDNPQLPFTPRFI